MSMKFYIEGKLEKVKKYWAISVPFLEIYTQGTSEKNALEMAKEAIELIAQKKGFAVSVEKSGDGIITVSANDEAFLAGLLIRRWRGANHIDRKSIVKALHMASINSLARYEQGKAMPKPETLLKILSAANKKKKAKFVLAMDE